MIQKYVQFLVLILCFSSAAEAQPIDITSANLNSYKIEGLPCRFDSQYGWAYIDGVKLTIEMKDGTRFSIKGNHSAREAGANRAEGCRDAEIALWQNKSLQDVDAFINDIANNQISIFTPANGSPICVKNYLRVYSTVSEVSLDNVYFGRRPASCP